MQDSINTKVEQVFYCKIQDITVPTTVNEKLEKMVSDGYAKTKSDAITFCVAAFSAPLPEEVEGKSKEEIENHKNTLAEKYAFQVPFNGTNDFYDKKKFKAFNDGFDAAVEFLSQFRTQPSKEDMAEAYSIEKIIEAANKCGVHSIDLLITALKNGNV